VHVSDSPMLLYATCVRPEYLVLMVLFQWWHL